MKSYIQKIGLALCVVWFAGCDQSNDDTITSYEHVK